MHSGSLWDLFLFNPPWEGGLAENNQNNSSQEKPIHRKGIL